MQGSLQLDETVWIGIRLYLSPETTRKAVFLRKSPGDVHHVSRPLRTLDSGYVHPRYRSVVRKRHSGRAGEHTAHRSPRPRPPRSSLNSVTRLWRASRRSLRSPRPPGRRSIRAAARCTESCCTGSRARPLEYVFDVLNVVAMADGAHSPFLSSCRRDR